MCSSTNAIYLLYQAHKLAIDICCEAQTHAWPPNHGLLAWPIISCHTASPGGFGLVPRKYTACRTGRPAWAKDHKSVGMIFPSPSNGMKPLWSGIGVCECLRQGNVREQQLVSQSQINHEMAKKIVKPTKHVERGAIHDAPGNSRHLI